MYIYTKNAFADIGRLSAYVLNNTGITNVLFEKKLDQEIIYQLPELLNLKIPTVCKIIDYACGVSSDTNTRKELYLFLQNNINNINKINLIDVFCQFDLNEIGQAGYRLIIEIIKEDLNQVGKPESDDEYEFITNINALPKRDTLLHAANIISHCVELSKRGFLTDEINLTEMGISTNELNNITTTYELMLTFEIEDFKEQFDDLVTRLKQQRCKIVPCRTKPNQQNYNVVSCEPKLHIQSVYSQSTYSISDYKSFSGNLSI